MENVEPMGGAEGPTCLQPVLWCGDVLEVQGHAQDQHIPRLKMCGTLTKLWSVGAAPLATPQAPGGSREAVRTEPPCPIPRALISHVPEPKQFP